MTDLQVGDLVRVLPRMLPPQIDTTQYAATGDVAQVKRVAMKTPRICLCASVLTHNLWPRDFWIPAKYLEKIE